MWRKIPWSSPKQTARKPIRRLSGRHPGRNLVAISLHILKVITSPRRREYKLRKMPEPHNTYPLLESIDTPADLRRLPQPKLAQLADELRQFLIQSVSTRGGHFAAGLGTVELTIALHYVFNTPHDRLVWDVGHQAYPHKEIGRAHV